MKSILENKFIDAIENHNPEALSKILINNSPNTKLELGFTPLMLCAGIKGTEDLAQILIDKNAQVNAVNNSQTSALKIATISKNVPLVKTLLEHGADPNQLDNTGITPLMYAVKSNHTEIIELLLSFGGDANKKSSAGNKSSIDFAKLTNNNSLLPLLEKPVDVTNKADSKIHIDDLIGQDIAKRQLNQIISLSKLNKERDKKNLKEVAVTLHCIYIGNPGTGKTTFARFFAQEIKEIGILKSGHLVEVGRNDLIAKYSGQTAEKTTEVFNRALDGILFIDEAYSLKTDENDQFGQECINTLITLIENNRNRIIVILAGYKDEMLEFMHLNPGLKSRIPNLIEFSDFSNSELENIMGKMLEKNGLITDEKNIVETVKEISKLRKERSFGNAREIRNSIDRSIVQQSVRLTKDNKSEFTSEELSTLIYSDFTSCPHDDGDFEDISQTIEKSNKSPLDKLNQLVGISEIKNEITELAHFVEVSKLRSPNKLPEIGLHMIFTGNPGTGKTTVARILGELLKDLDLLSTGHVVEVDRSQLVAPFVGQTAIKTKEAIDRALGGILFIDEAYTLYRNEKSDSFGVECIDTILKYMEDYRSRLVVIFAGYPKQMDIFISANPGLKSRINRRLNFPDFTNDQLIDIAKIMASEKNYLISEDAKPQIKESIEKERTVSDFGNARTMRNLLEKSYKKHATRLINLKKDKELTTDDLNTLIKEDFSF